MPSCSHLTVVLGGQMTYVGLQKVVAYCRLPAVSVSTMYYTAWRENFQAFLTKRRKKSLCLSVREVMWGMFPITLASNDSEYLLFRIACQGTPLKPRTTRFASGRTRLSAWFMRSLQSRFSAHSRRVNHVLPNMNMVDICAFCFSR